MMHIDPRAFYRYVRPTFLTEWTEPLRALSFKTELVYLTAEESDVLRRGPLSRGPVWGMSNPITSGLLGKLRAALDKLGGTAFVRTQTRSPKDSALFRQHAGRVSHPWFALVMLQSSRRFHEDAAWLEANGALPVIALREWVPLPAGLEFRSIVRNGECVGVTQRPSDIAASPLLDRYALEVQSLLLTFTAECVRRSTIESAVYDLCLLRPPSPKLTVADMRLIELNPWHVATDLYAFNASKPGALDGSFRFHA